MRVSCPHCSAPALLRSSKRLSPVIRDAYILCRNPECGWRGKLLLEFYATLSPSERPAPEVDIPLDTHSRRRLVAQLSPEPE